jgi:hypothetical protein
MRLLISISHGPSVRSSLLPTTASARLTSVVAEPLYCALLLGKPPTLSGYFWRKEDIDILSPGTLVQDTTHPERDKVG